MKRDYCSFKYKNKFSNNQYCVEEIYGGYLLRIFSVNGDLADIMKIKKLFLVEQISLN